MKKDLIFPIMLLLGATLFLLRFMGVSANIAITVVGVLVWVAYTVLTKKEWKIPALEIIMRAFCGIALIAGRTFTASLRLLSFTRLVLFCLRCLSSLCFLIS